MRIGKIALIAAVLVFPAWAAPGGNYYDIEANAPGESAPPPDQIRLMLQVLLAGRFQLKLHRNSKELPVYNLVIGKNGPKLKAIPADSPRVVTTPPMWRSSIEQLDSTIARFLDRPLIDKTGLAGAFEYTLNLGQLDLDRAGDPAGFATGVPISTAVQEQLGLKLESTRERVEILVVDHAEKPSEN